MKDSKTRSIKLSDIWISIKYLFYSWFLSGVITTLIFINPLGIIKQNPRILLFLPITLVMFLPNLLNVILVWSLLQNLFAGLLVFKKINDLGQRKKIITLNLIFSIPSIIVFSLLYYAIFAIISTIYLEIKF